MPEIDIRIVPFFALKSCEHKNKPCVCHGTQLLTTIDAKQIHLDITQNFDLTKLYLDVVSLYIRYGHPTQFFLKLCLTLSSAGRETGTQSGVASFGSYTLSVVKKLVK